MKGRSDAQDDGDDRDDQVRRRNHGSTVASIAIRARGQPVGCRRTLGPGAPGAFDVVVRATAPRAA